MGFWRRRLLAGAGLVFVMTGSVLTAPQPTTPTKATVESPVQLSVLAALDDFRNWLIQEAT